MQRSIIRLNLHQKVHKIRTIKAREICTRKYKKPQYLTTAPRGKQLADKKWPFSGQKGCFNGGSG
jgi:hypothetical protein